MITSHLAIWIMGGLALLLAIIIPILNTTKRLSEFISFRWTCVAIILLIMVCVVIDFDHLSDGTRDIVLKGGIIIIGIYLSLRTAEKVLSKGWLNKINVKGTIQKGDLTATAEISHTEEVKTESKAEESQSE